MSATNPCSRCTADSCNLFFSPYTYNHMAGWQVN